MSLTITNREVDGVAVVTLDGRVVFGDAASALRDKVKTLTDAGNRKVVLNINNVTFVDSAGLGAMVAAHHTANSAGGALRLCHLEPKFKEMLRMTNLHTVFEVSDTEADAIRILSAS